MTLLDFINNSDGLVRFWRLTHVGGYGLSWLPSEPGVNGIEEQYFDLEGNVDDDTWRWNGEGRPTDEQNNTLANLTATKLAQREWKRLLNEIEN